MSLTKLEAFFWPVADSEVKAALDESYESGSWGQYHGPNCEELIEQLSQYFDCEHAALCSSGTVGVELALRGCGIAPGEGVALAGYDFPGNFRAVDALAARPVLVDICKESWSLDADSLADISHDDIKAVIVSHLHGGLADMPRIMSLARSRGWLVVEDACQQPGALQQGQKVGTWGDVGVLSFGGSKLLTAGRGGAVLSNNAGIIQRMKIYSEQGNQAYPLSELQAAVLRPQLRKLDERNEVRRQRIELIRQKTAELADCLQPVAKPNGGLSAFYKFAWSYLPAEDKPERRDELLKRLHERNVPIDGGFRGFTSRGARRCEKPVPLPVSDRLSRSTILLHHPILLAHEKVALQLAEVLNQVVRQTTS